MEIRHTFWVSLGGGDDPVDHRDHLKTDQIITTSIFLQINILKSRRDGFSMRLTVLSLNNVSGVSFYWGRRLALFRTLTQVHKDGKEAELNNGAGAECVKQYSLWSIFVASTITIVVSSLTAISIKNIFIISISS